MVLPVCDCWRYLKSLLQWCNLCVIDGDIQSPIFLKRQSSRVPYRKRIREKQTATTESYSNDLHEALLKKNGTAFWRCWRSNFESKSKCSQVKGCIDPDVIADKFADHFKTSISCNDPDRAESPKKVVP